MRTYCAEVEDNRDVPVARQHAATPASGLPSHCCSPSQFGFSYVVDRRAIDRVQLLARQISIEPARPIRFAQDAHSYIALAQGSGNRFLIDQALANSQSRPRWFCEVNHVPALVSLVLAGLGVGVVPRMALPPDGHDGLSAVPVVEPRVSRTLGLIHRRGRPLAAAANLLYEMLVNRSPKARGRRLRNAS